MGAGPGDPAGSGAPAGRASTPMLESLAAFVDLVDDLRRGCPWDAEQTHASLRPHLLEEAHELLEALDALEALESGDAPGDHLAGALAHVQEELGDLLFQVVFHSRIAVESGHFDLGDVAQGIHDKLHHRHPHVFGDTEVDGPDEVVANWDRIKQAEKGRSSVLDGIPPTLPALARAAKTLRRASPRNRRPAVRPTPRGWGRPCWTWLPGRGRPASTPRRRCGRRWRGSAAGSGTPRGGSPPTADHAARVFGPISRAERPNTSPVLPVTWPEPGATALHHRIRPPTRPTGRTS